MVGKSANTEIVTSNGHSVTTTTTRSTNLRGVTTEKKQVTVNGQLQSAVEVVTQKDGSAVETTTRGDGTTRTVAWVATRNELTAGIHPRPSPERSLPVRSR